MAEKISPRQFHDSAGVDDWRVIGDGVCAVFRPASFSEGTRFAHAISELASPDIDVRRDSVTVRLINVGEGFYGLTAQDVETAQQISELARKHGLRADPAAVQNIQVCIDALVIPEVLPFWRAVFGYEDRGDCPDDLIDAKRRGPLTYFQQMDAPREQRNRVHFDVWVAHDQAEARVKAALAAGGRLVSDEQAPHWWVLADAEGNEACVCTWQRPE
ncbi:VOC family protein [Catelliglobosispora koreensis]|uniref:VOC family protein n=1 Tax=Catelliglobosispora koreensis TaxID=129052 RepID=UPI00037FFEFF|nr:VOC family protein [Catelliglobosispora koreensis]